MPQPHLNQTLKFYTFLPCGGGYPELPQLVYVYTHVDWGFHRAKYCKEKPWESPAATTFLEALGFSLYTSIATMSHRWHSWPLWWPLGPDWWCFIPDRFHLLNSWWLTPLGITGRGIWARWPSGAFMAYGGSLRHPPHIPHTLHLLAYAKGPPYMISQNYPYSSLCPQGKKQPEQSPLYTPMGVLLLILWVLRLVDTWSVVFSKQEYL